MEGKSHLDADKFIVPQESVQFLMEDILMPNGSNVDANVDG